jgi:hypothetical protein
MLPLQLYGELSQGETEELKEHLSGCGECRKELDKIKQLHGLLSRHPVPEPSEEMLRESRMRFQSALLAERLRAPVWDRIKELLSLPAVYRPAIGVTAALLLAIGFLGGRLVTGVGETQQDARLIPTEGLRVTNVRYVGGEGDDVELAFDSVTPVRLRGRISSPEVQKVLARAVISGDNAGVRLRAVGSLSASPEARLEPETKAALLLVLKTDKNDGVRKEALQVLLRSTADREVRDGLLYVVLNDSNPGLRIAAINGLASMQTSRYQPDEETIRALRESLVKEDNLYVRVKARSILGEEKIQ